MARTLLFIGICSAILSFGSFIVDSTPLSDFILGTFSFLGIICISEFITIRLAGTSFIGTLKSSRRAFFTFLLATTLAGVILEGIYKFLLNLWIYPDWSLEFYAIVFIPGFAFYWLTLTESYLAARAVTRRFLRNGFAIPLVAVLLGSAIASIVIEAQNIPTQLWTYTNWPSLFGQAYGIPVFVFFIWPTQYALFLLLYKLLSRKLQNTTRST